MTPWESVKTGMSRIVGIDLGTTNSLVAFMDGPVVLAGLCEEGRTLYGEPSSPEAMLIGDAAYDVWRWLPGYRTKDQPANFRLIPLYEVRDERYTVYFPIRKA